MIGKISVVSTAGQIDYLKTQYLSKGAEETRFLGEGSKALGLTAQTDEAVLALCDGRNPLTEETLVEGGTGIVKREKLAADGAVVTPEERGPVRRAGWEFALSADKTVSLAMAFGDEKLRRDIETAHDRAVARAVCVAEGLLDVRTTQDKGERVREPAKAVFSTYRHMASRELDPQLHSHVFLANMGQRPDGTWAALSVERLMETKFLVGQAYQAALYEELAARGVAATKVDMEPSAETGGGGEPFVATVIDAMEKYAPEYSKRRTQILEKLEKDGKSGRYWAQRACLSERKAKDEPPPEEMLAMWKAAAPITEAEATNAVRGLAMGADDAMPTPNEIVQRLIDETCLTKAALTDADIAKAMARGLAKWTDENGILEAIEAGKKHEGLLLGGPDERTGLMRYVSTRVLDLEAQMTRRMDTLSKRSHSVGSEAIAKAFGAARADGLILSKEQENAVHYALAGTGGLAVLEGHAGSGKTTLLRIAVAAWEADGHRCFGVSKSAKATKKMGLEIPGLQASTIDALLRDLDRKKLTLRQGDVIVVDEAGMADTACLANLTTRVEAAQAKLVLCGDRRQHQAIGMGGGFAYAADNLTVFSLTENRRQSDEQDKLDALVFRKGSASELRAVYDRWQGEGRLQVETTVKAAAIRAANDWLEATGEDGKPLEFDQKILIAERRATVAIMNQHIHDTLARRGLLAGESHDLRVAPTETDGPVKRPVYETVSAAVGDRIVFCKNSGRKDQIVDPETGKSSSVLNGDTAILTDMRFEQGNWFLEARMDDGRQVAWRSDRFDRWDIGYAMTNHKSQGQSVEKSFICTQSPDRYLSYVGQTRHKTESRTYTTEDAIDRLAMASARENPAELATKLVQSYRAKLDSDIARHEAKLVAEARAVIEAEARAVIEAEARAVIEAENKARMEAEAKARAAQEAARAVQRPEPARTEATPPARAPEAASGPQTAVWKAVVPKVGPVEFKSDTGETRTLPRQEAAKVFGITADELTNARGDIQKMAFKIDFSSTPKLEAAQTRADKPWLPPAKSQQNIKAYGQAQGFGR